jgi:hypothetical protein
MSPPASVLFLSLLAQSDPPSALEWQVRHWSMILKSRRADPFGDPRLVAALEMIDRPGTEHLAHAIRTGRISAHWTDETLIAGTWRNRLYLNPDGPLETVASDLVHEATHAYGYVARWEHATEAEAYRAEARFAKLTGAPSTFRLERLEKMTDDEIHAALEQQFPDNYKPLGGSIPRRAHHVVPWALLLWTGTLGKLPAPRLAAGLAAAGRAGWIGITVFELLAGIRPWKAIGVTNVSYGASSIAVNQVADRFLYPLLFRAGPPGWAAAAVYGVAKGAAAYYAGDTVERVLRALLRPDIMKTYRAPTPRRDGVVDRVRQIGAAVPQP